MDLQTLFQIADHARARKKLTPTEVAIVREGLPNELTAYPKLDLPKSVRHPAGFTITGAPVGTFVRCALLLAGQTVLGRRYQNSPFYERVEQDVAFGIMRSHFHNGYPKGTYCCVACSLAVYTVLEAGAIRYFDCKQLTQELARMIDEGAWRFANPINEKLLHWALG